jgi:REP-associated tyrosine transposase
LAAARYVELNPVNAGIVRESGDYRWSSARFHLGLTSGDALVKDKTLLGLIDDRTNYLKGDDEPRIQTTLLRGIRTGRPAGSEQFIEMIERLTGRDLMIRRAGRPLKRVS